MRLDGQHRFPKMEYLLGLIKAVKHDYRAAAEHIGNYLRLSPNASDAPAIQKQLADFQKLAALVPAQDTNADTPKIPR